MDWGLGHAARCIPLIKCLLSLGNRVIIGGDGRSFALLKSYFPDLPAYELPAYDIKYSRFNSQIPVLLAQVPRLLSVFGQEREALAQILKKERIDIVIADNRYGLHSPAAHCIYMTHQIAPMTPLRYVVYALQKRFIQRFDQIWIPDVAGDSSLSGSLSAAYPLPPDTHYVGLLSRFQGLSCTPSPTPTYKIAAILSGPEPQRSLLEAAFVAQCQLFPQHQFLLVQGKTETHESHQQGNLTIHSCLHEHEWQAIFEQSEIVLARSGYSSLMDFATLGLPKVVLIPTPGQTEQEYLALHLAKQGLCLSTTQASLDFGKIFDEIDNFKGFVRQDSGDLAVQVSRLLAGVVRK